MNYVVEQMPSSRQAFASYGYTISINGVVIACFWHDFRGEFERIDLIDSGRSEYPPFANCTDFLTGGGPMPLGLTQAAIDYLNSVLH